MERLVAWMLALTVVMVSLLSRTTHAFLPQPARAPLPTTGVATTTITTSAYGFHPSSKTYTRYYAAGDGGDDDEDDDQEEVIPGKMKVGEIKAELELRGVSFAGIYERGELEKLLLQARKEGRARPEILNQFNANYEERKRQEESVKKEVLEFVDDVFDVGAAKAGDGNLPGGVSPDDLSKLTNNSEIMDIVANPKLQELMKAVMEKDNAKIMEFSRDPEINGLLSKFRELATASGLDPSKFSM